MSDKDLRILLSTKGHPYERQPFYDVFDDMEGVDWTHVEQPASQALMTVEQAAAYDALVLYDMPGIHFDTAPPTITPPTEAFKNNFLELVEAGHGFVFLHHALAGWQDWDTYAEIMGGRFLYLPRTVRGKDCQDSGYRHDVTHQVSKLADHPVTKGIPDSFDITDELYLCEVFEDEVTPLLHSDYAFQAENFYSASAAVCDGRMNDNAGWKHTKGSALVGWSKEVGKSRIVYLQFGDGPSAYGNPHYRRLVCNAIHWVAQSRS
ncbi:MAG: ThuA domain-containing protein [Parvibaculales bacterium]